MKKGDKVKGDHNVFQAGSMMVKFVQNNYNKVPGGWASADDEDYTEYEEVDPRNTAKKFMDEEPNFFQTGRYLKAVLNGKWFDEMRTKNEYTQKWRDDFVESLLDSDYGWEIATMWEDQSRRETLKAHIVGCLKDAGVLDAAYDQIARALGYGGEDYRTFSRNIGRCKKQAYYLWILEYVQKGK